MRVFRRVMLGGGIDIDALPDTQKIYYKATAKVTPKSNSLGALLIANEWNASTNEGIIGYNNTIRTIGSYAFSEATGLISITIPNSVTSIREYAFHGCTSLTSVTIPNSVTEIGSWAFSYCDSLTSITIPDSVISIGNHAFAFNSITRIDITDLSAWCKISFEQHSTNGGKLYLNGSELTDMAIPSDITEIKGFTFNGCTSLTNVTIPDSVTSIRYYAFCDCSNLTSITIPDSVTKIEWNAFEDCTSLTSIIIPNSVTTIADKTFWGCTSLTSVTIGNGVTSIGTLAFRGCNSLTNVTIPDSVTSIGEYAFMGCRAIQYYDFSTHNTIPNLVNTDTFYSISSTCKIIVPDALYDEWIATTNWSTYASYIIKKSDWDASQTTE